MDWTISERRAYEFVSASTIELLVQELNEAAENGYEICGGPMQKGSLYYCIVKTVGIGLEGVQCSIQDLSKLIEHLIKLQ